MAYSSYDTDSVDDIVGLDIVGNPASRNSQRELARGRNARAHGPGGTAAYNERQQNVTRLQTAPIPLTTIAPGATITIVINPQQAIRFERLGLFGSVASPTQVYLSDARIGNRPQTVNQGEIPIEMFYPQAVGSRFRGDTAHPGMVILLTFRNASGVPVDVSGMVQGESYQE